MPIYLPPYLPRRRLFGDLQQLYRRICLLRAGQRILEARQLEDADLPRALAAVRAMGADERIAPLLAVEEDRVAEARALAELLAPILTRQLNLTLAPTPADGLVTAPPSRLPVHTVAPSIADFIDGMIAQERPAHASSTSASTSSRHQPAIHPSP